MDINIEKMYECLGIDKKVLDFGLEVENSLTKRFSEIDKTTEYNQLKVIKAMQENKVSAECFNTATGYGYDDVGRDTLEKVYASCFHCEDALVRPQITCGTHALAVALSGNLRPGDELLSPVGKPYDTLEEVIGIRPSKGSLAEYGVSYKQVDLLENGGFDFENIKKAINPKTKMVTIQRPKGYQTRPKLSVKRIGELISFIKNIRKRRPPRLVISTKIMLMIFLMTTMKIHVPMLTSMLKPQKTRLRKIERTMLRNKSEGRGIRCKKIPVRRTGILYYLFIYSLVTSFNAFRICSGS